MKKKEEQISVVNPKQGTISGELGLTEEQRLDVTKRTDAIVKKNMEDDNATRTDGIVEVYNEFENPAECAFALYILSHEENGIAIHSLFQLPEAVADEQLS